MDTMGSFAKIDGTSVALQDTLNVDGFGTVHAQVGAVSIEAEGGAPGIVNNVLLFSFYINISRVLSLSFSKAKRLTNVLSRYN
jgi:hypothetical protein